MPPAVSAKENLCCISWEGDGYLRSEKKKWCSESVLLHNPTSGWGGKGVTNPCAVYELLNSEWVIRNKVFKAVEGH